MIAHAFNGLRALALVLAIGAGGCRVAAAESLHVHYGVTLIGLPIGSATVTGAVEPASYKIEANAKLTGLASVLSSSHGAATAVGVLAGDRVAPSSYASSSANSTMTRTVRIAMNAGTVVGVDIAPPYDPQIPRVPISDADKRNIVDPLSAFVTIVPPGAGGLGPQACNRTLPVFDGAVRFDVVLSYVGTRHVQAKGFDGNVAVCAARYRPISGHRVDSKASQFMADNKNLEVWLAPVAGTHVAMPFRIAVRTQVGTTVIEADEFSVEATHASAR